MESVSSTVAAKNTALGTPLTLSFHLLPIIDPSWTPGIDWITERHTTKSSKLLKLLLLCFKWSMPQKHTDKNHTAKSKRVEQTPRRMDSESKSPSPRHVLFLLYGILMFLSSNNATFSSAQTSNSSDSEADRQALLCFKSGISADPVGVLRSWRNDSLNFCSWRGVNCSTTLPIRVVSLELRSLQLKGQLSSCMVTLTSLVRVDLSNNDLSGSIPEEIGAIPSLETLMLAGNRLAGIIPLSLGTSASLRYVYLAANNLSGVIPGTLFNNSSNLVAVDFSRNSLSGAIPYFQKTTSLILLDLSANFLSGSIPASLVLVYYVY